jgi:cysteine desulfuration protein SufE
MSIQNAISELTSDFKEIEVKDRLELLLEFSEKLPELPAKYSEHPDLLERVEECQAPVYLFVEVDSDVDKTVHLYFSAPAEAPTTRGFASILQEILDGAAASDILQVDDDFPNQLGLTEAISPLRMRGMRAMLARIKRNINEKLA